MVVVMVKYNNQILTKQILYNENSVILLHSKNKKMKKTIIYSTLLFLIFLPIWGDDTRLNLYGKIYELFFMSILFIYFFKNDYEPKECETSDTSK